MREGRPCGGRGERLTALCRRIVRASTHALAARRHARPLPRPPRWLICPGRATACSHVRTPPFPAVPFVTQPTQTNQRTAPAQDQRRGSCVHPAACLSGGACASERPKARQVHGGGPLECDGASPTRRCTDGARAQGSRPGRARRVRLRQVRLYLVNVLSLDVYCVSTDKLHIAIQHTHPRPRDGPIFAPFRAAVGPPWPPRCTTAAAALPTVACAAAGPRQAPRSPVPAPSGPAPRPWCGSGR